MEMILKNITLQSSEMYISQSLKYLTDSLSQICLL